MSTTPAKPLGAEGIPSQTPSEAASTRRAIAWSSFLFALLQSVCSFFAATSGLRLVIGVGSLAVGSGLAATLDRLHADWIRVPMIGLALAGALLNLVVLWQVRRLRSRPASQWRQRPLTAGKAGAEWTQLGLAIATLVLVGIEEYFHLLTRHHL